MRLEINTTHHFGKDFTRLGFRLSQEEIAACALHNEGLEPAAALALPDVPDSIKQVIGALPYGASGKRKHSWVYIRPQYCDLAKPDSRIGSFYHLDVDALGRSVAPAWDEFRAMAVTFGDIAEVEFIDEPMTIEVPDRPSSKEYATLAGYFHNRDFKTHSPANGQIVHYRTTDAHRAGPIRRTGWRLIILVFETNGEIWP